MDHAPRRQRTTTAPRLPSGFGVEPKYSPNGRWIAFDRLLITPGGDQQQAVFIVNAAGGSAWQLTPWELNAEHPTWSPDSDSVLFNTPGGTIAAMRPDGSFRRTILAATPTLGGHKPWYSPDARKILFMCATPSGDAHNEDICVMNADATRIIDVTNTPTTNENWPSWSPSDKGCRARCGASSTAGIVRRDGSVTHGTQPRTDRIENARARHADSGPA